MTTDILKANTISMIELMDRKEIELARQAVTVIFTMNAEKKDKNLENLQDLIDALNKAIQ